MATYLGHEPAARPAQVRAVLLRQATPGALRHLPGRSPNVLLRAPDP